MEKILQLNGVKQSKIGRMVVKIKFIQKNLKKIGKYNIRKLALRI